jgi:cellulose synthase/poly-beta-1,6-N-acetylglucosamine synthase-like glycosyltransferase
MEWIIVILYSFALFYIFLFSLSQLHLTWIYRKHKATSHAPALTDFPSVTIQLPVYNEKYVINRLLEAVSKIDYPREKLEVQILDDSTDETTKIILDKIQELRGLNMDFKLLHREQRDGYKAGALANGLRSATGDLIAIFDADFIPQSDFLIKTVPYFTNPTIGVVQTRWAHVNKDYSFLTELQAFGLDAHFSIEQSARNAVNSFINFNGTCGVWRKETIESAGGWKDDTLTEDLDLSYRAQLKGWKFKYLEDVSTPGELPILMPAIKSQQYRWNKGGAETARKLIAKVFWSSTSFRQKFHAFFHLFNSSVFFWLLIAAVLSIPMLYIKSSHPALEHLFNIGIVLIIGFLSIAFFYWTSTKQFYQRPLKAFFRLFPGFMIVSMGLSLHNGLAVIEGLLGVKTPFIRTPKFNVVTKKDSWKQNTYLHSSISWITLLEGALCLYFVFGIVLGIRLHDTGLLFFHTLLAAGFGLVFYHSVKPAMMSSYHE